MTKLRVIKYGEDYFDNNDKGMYVSFKKTFLMASDGFFETFNCTHRIKQDDNAYRSTFKNPLSNKFFSQK